MNARRNEGFTLVELIIVIIIIGILAALAIPQFVTSTDDAKIATLQANLAVSRNAINLYYHQHNSQYPGAKKEDGSGSDTVGADNPAAFVNQLTQYTSAVGATTDTLNRTTHPFGHYFQTGIPDNPMNGLATVLVLTNSAPLAVGDITGATGWIYSKVTGEIRANTTNYISY